MFLELYSSWFVLAWMKGKKIRFYKALVKRISPWIPFIDLSCMCISRKYTKHACKSIIYIYMHKLSPPALHLPAKKHYKQDSCLPFRQALCYFKFYWCYSSTVPLILPSKTQLHYIYCMSTGTQDVVLVACSKVIELFLQYYPMKKL